VIRQYQADGAEVKRVPEFIPGCWIDAIEPTKDELHTLHERFAVPQEFLEYALDPDERPRYERSGEWTLFVLQASHWLGEGQDVPYDTVPMAIIHAPQQIITLCEFRHTVLLDLRHGRLKPSDSRDQTTFTLQVFMRVAQRYIQNLSTISRKVDEIETRLESSTRNQELLELMRLEKSLVYFKVALRANIAMLERMRRDRVLALSPEQLDFLDDIQVENSQALEMTDITIEILGTMAGAFASIISNNVNTVMKRLTVATILIAVPTWITGLFGMNVQLPLEKISGAFVVILLLCIAAVSWLLTLFRRWRWL
jgi:magnesium transporter